MFPLSIWVPHGYPREVPLAFVTPTKEMAVRPGQHVSGEGRIYHPYLAGWRPEVSRALHIKPHERGIYTLMGSQVMLDISSETPNHHLG